MAVPTIRVIKVLVSVSILFPVSGKMLRGVCTLKTHHVYCTLKRHRNERFHIVSTWNTRGMFVEYLSVMNKG